MQTTNVPAVGARYWAALSVASVFGANMGDFVSKNLHMGHWSGLPPLAVLFVAVLAAERWGKWRGEFYYWIAIVVLRTAATNLGDLLTHDFKLPATLTIAALIAAMVALLAASPRTTQTQDVPTTDDWYWATMLTAGTLGTVAGDWVADDWGFGLGGGSIILCAILAAVLFVRDTMKMTQRSVYWVVVVAIRSAGTTVGDYLAGRHGLALGLSVSTPLTGLILVALLVCWRRTPLPRTEVAASRS